MRAIITLGMAVSMLLVGCTRTQIVEAQRVESTKKSEPPTVSAEEKAGTVPVLRPLMPQFPLIPKTPSKEEKSAQ